MGADLYIYKLFGPTRKKFEPLFNEACRQRDAKMCELAASRGLPNQYAVSVEEPEVKALQEKVSEYYDKMYSKGYFRDSYNCTNVLNRMGLSYWTDLSKLLNSRRNLSGKNLQKFRDMVVNAQLRLPTVEELRKEGATVDDGENSIEKWHAMFKDNRKKLIEFLNLAIEMRTYIYCSV